MYGFEDGSGTTATDSIASDDATLNAGVSWITSAGTGSGAVHFDGITGSAVVPNDAAFETQSFTIAMWIRSSSAKAGQVLIAKGAGSGATPCRTAWVLRTSGDGDGTPATGLQFNFDGPSGFGFGGGGNPSPFWDGTWHAIALTWDASTGTDRLYVDGREPGGGSSGAMTHSFDTSGSHDLTMGNFGASCASFSPYSGDLDDVRLFDRALTAAEVINLLPPISTTTTLAFSASTIQKGSAVTMTATLTPTPHFFVGCCSFQAVRASDGFVRNLPFDSSTGPGNGSVTVNDLLGGTWSVTARFPGLAAYLPSSSTAQALLVSGLPTSLAFEYGPDTIPSGRTAQIRVQFTPAFSEGNVTFTATEVATGTPHAVGTAPVLFNPHVISPKEAEATLDWPTDLPLGDYSLSAHFNGSDNWLASTTTESYAITVGPLPTDTNIDVSGPYDASGSTALLHDTITVGSATDISDAPYPLAGTVTFTATSGATVVTLGTADPDDSIDVDTSVLSVGTWKLKARYGGSSDYAASFGTATIQILPDTVDADHVGVDFDTFYPFTDGYRDELTISGHRNEAASVTISVLSPHGSEVRHVSIPLGSGHYGTTWDGRTTSGQMLSAGTYKVVQKLTDGEGNHKTFTDKVVLSDKKLVWKNATITIDASDTAARGTNGSGTITAYHDGHVKLSVPHAGFAGVGYQFQVPLGLAYEAPKFQVDAVNGHVPPTSFGMQDFDTCSYQTTGDWDTSCFDLTGDVGPSRSWSSTSGDVDTNMHGRIVRGIVSDPGGTTLIYQVRVKIRYSVLQ